MESIEESYNMFKDGIFEINQVVMINECMPGNTKQFRPYIIKEIYRKNGYNMYLCEHLKTKCKAAITDMDYFCKSAYVMDDVEV